MILTYRRTALNKLGMSKHVKADVRLMNAFIQKLSLVVGLLSDESIDEVYSKLIDDSIKSTGLLAVSDTGAAIGSASQLTQTATLLSTGTLVVGAKPGSSTYGTFVVSGGHITGGAGSTVSVGNVRAYSASNTAFTISVVPDAGVTSFNVSYYESTSSNTLTTLTGKVVVTVTATNAYGAVSAPDTTVYYGTAASATSDTATTDSTSSNYSKANAATILGTISLYDGLGNAVTTGTGVLSATVTGGAVVNLSTSATPGAGTGTTAYLAQSTSSKTHYFSIAQGTENVAASGTITIKYNDTVLATKSFTIAGQVAKIVVTNVKIGRTGASSASSFNVALEDAAGNAVYASSGISAATTTGLNNAVTAVTISTYPSNSSTTGVGNFTCSGTAGAGTTTDGSKASVKLRMLNAAGDYVYSSPVDMKCGGDAYAFTASLDKATYAPGDIATLTVKVTDSKGNPANSYYTLTAADATGSDTYLPTFGNAPGTIVTAAAKGDLLTNGEKTYQWTIAADAVAGTRNMVVDFPYIRTTANTAGTQGKITIPYTISSNGGVSNTEVLAAIVKLIASINKQIVALQKLITKKK